MIYFNSSHNKSDNNRHITLPLYDLTYAIQDLELVIKENKAQGRLKKLAKREKRKRDVRFCFACSFFLRPAACLSQKDAVIGDVSAVTRTHESTRNETTPPLPTVYSPNISHFSFQ